MDEHLGMDANSRQVMWDRSTRVAEDWDIRWPTGHVGQVNAGSGRLGHEMADRSCGKGQHV